MHATLQQASPQVYNLQGYAIPREGFLAIARFMIGKMLKQNDGALLASTFAEWHREGKILAHEKLDKFVRKARNSERIHWVHVKGPLCFKESPSDITAKAG